MRIAPEEILETIKMIEDLNLDIRTITMGISLFDCSDSSETVTNKKVFEKIYKLAKNLKKEAKALENKYGLPIVNKRISITPVSLFYTTKSIDSIVDLSKNFDKIACELDIDFIGGFGCLVHKGETEIDKIIMDSLPFVLSETNKVCSFVNVASTKSGINMDAILKMGKIIKEIAYKTRDKDSIGCAKLVVFANAVEDNPFMAGAFHGPGEPECSINVGVSGPGVVKYALKKLGGDANLGEVAETIKKVAFKITRAGELIGKEMAKRLGVSFGILDLSLAPTPAVGDSVAEILESMGLESTGAFGTVAALFILNDAVKKGGLFASSSVGGLSGAFIPVSEDRGMVDAVKRRSLNLEMLMAMTSVCSVGLDMIVIPGDTPEEIISAIIADESAIGVANNKTTGVRIIPAYDKKVGDYVSFGGLLGEAPVMAINNYSPLNFVKRGGRIPSPIIGFRN
jgi:uncharacterized protein (UPF0210 family)